MLKYVNQFWRFNSEQELNSFLSDAAKSSDDYELQRSGKARNGTYYAFGDVKVNPTKEEEDAKPQSENNVPELV